MIRDNGVQYTNMMLILPFLVLLASVEDRTLGQTGVCSDWHYLLTLIPGNTMEKHDIHIHLIVMN